MKVHFSDGVSVSPQEVIEAPVFRDWCRRLPPAWRGDVTVAAVDAWGGEVHMIQLTVAREGSPWPVKLMLRSETVDILALVTDDTQQWVVFVEQEREAAGNRVFSNPAGGREWSETADEAANRELREELGLDDVRINFQVSLSHLVRRPVLATPGITNERVYMLQAVLKVAPQDLQEFLEELRDKKTGVTAEGEELTLCVVPASQACDFIERQQDPDAKTLLALKYAGL